MCGLTNTEIKQILYVKHGVHGTKLEHREPINYREPDFERCKEYLEEHSHLFEEDTKVCTGKRTRFHDQRMGA